MRIPWSQISIHLFPDTWNSTAPEHPRAHPDRVSIAPQIVTVTHHTHLHDHPSLEAPLPRSSPDHSHLSPLPVLHSKDTAPPSLPLPTPPSLRELSSTLFTPRASGAVVRAHRGRVIPARPLLPCPPNPYPNPQPPQPLTKHQNPRPQTPKPSTINTEKNPSAA